MTVDLAALLEQVASCSQGIAGGCSECCARQHVKRLTAQLWAVEVSHATSCPLLRARAGERWG